MLAPHELSSTRPVAAGALGKALKVWSRFRVGQAGTIAVAFCLASPVALGVIGLAVDAARWNSHKTDLQNLADGAALSAAHEIQLGASEERLGEVVEAYITGVGKGDLVEFETNAVRGAAPEGAALSRTQASIEGLTVRVSQKMELTFGQLLLPELDAIQVSATVMARGIRICVVGLDESGADTLRLDDKAKLSAGDCSVYVNSSSPVAIHANDKSLVDSLMICSTGGYQGSATNFAPNVPVTDCPVTSDPLAHREIPASSACPLNAEPLVLIGVTRTLSPGTYCGGLVIDKGASVTLSPGIYVIKNGPLIVGPRGQVKKYGEADDDEGDNDDEADEGSKGFLRGTNVGFFFTGTVPPDADGSVVVMRFMKNSEVEITAPTDGPMAGLLFHEDRTSPADRRFEIISDKARRLVGTIYLPRGVFQVSSKQKVADLSEYTAIVTRRMELSKAPNLVLNTRYGDTDVPVPEGLGPNGSVALTR
jgi:hypothetical protein